MTENLLIEYYVRDTLFCKKESDKYDKKTESKCKYIWFLQFSVKGRVIVKCIFVHLSFLFLFLQIHQFKKVQELEGRSPVISP